MTSLERVAGTARLVAWLARHALRPEPTRTLAQRLAMLPTRNAPLKHPVTIRWNAHHVPFIEAQSDPDLATALGIAHAHLRLGQMELFRRVAYGRVSEMIGPPGIRIDHLLRAVDCARAVPAMLAALPADTRAWIEAFARGINHVLMNSGQPPPEFALFALRREAWTAADVLALGRLMSVDVNWLMLFPLLKFREDADWRGMWQAMLRADRRFDSRPPDAPELGLLNSAMRFGSNCCVVAAAHAEGRAALIASDPHLSVTLPNSWMLAGIRSPGYHAVGLMLPGVPFIALGRNPWIAWGGTSLHAASSELVALGDAALSAAREREETLNVRWGSPRKLRIRETAWGPVISDVPLLAARGSPVALRWMGHQPSDEITAMLAVNRARDRQAFRAALAGFGVPGQNMLCAEATGGIGRMMAAHLPRRPAAAADDDIAAGPSPGWETPLTGADLPHEFDPAEGFLASANERPAKDAGLVGRHFSAPYRKARLDQLLRDQPVSVAALMRLQRDVHSAAAKAQLAEILAWAGTRRSRRERELVAALAAWDGGYTAGSRAAAAFELLLYHLVRLLVPRRRRAAWHAAWGSRRVLWDAVVAADPARRERCLARALRLTARRGLRVGWGQRHRLRLAHPLARVPVLGRSWVYADRPAPGAWDTLMKAGAGLAPGRHDVEIGSVARHVSDLGDPDRNHFVLLGGQDGWPGSTTALDQVALWESGAYLLLPMSPAAVAASFPLTTEPRP